MQKAVFCLAVLVALVGTAVAGKAKKSKLPCGGSVSCARACSTKHLAACDRLFTLVDRDLELSRGYQSTAAPAYQAARANLPAVCKAKQPRACVLLGRLEEQGLGGSSDPETAKQRFQAACDDGVDAGCVALANAYVAGTISGASLDSALSTLEDACSHHQQEACAHLGDLLLKKSYEQRDHDRGTGLLADACDAGSAFACEDLGYGYANGWPLRADAALGSRYNRKACKLGDSMACYAVAGKTPLDDDARAVLGVACTGGDPGACDSLANAEPKADKKQAYRDQACLAGSAWECDSIAQTLEDPATGRVKASKDRARWERLRTAGCADGNQGSCVKLATADLPMPPAPVWDDKTGKYLPVKVVPSPSKKVVTKALAALSGYCDDGNESACLEMSRIYTEEWYQATDADKAHRAVSRYCDLSASWRDEEMAYGGSGECYELADVDRKSADIVDHAACKKGDLEACLRYGKVYWDHVDDREAALEKACDGKLQLACSALARLHFDNDNATDVSAVVTACDGGAADECDWIATGGDRIDPAVRLRAAQKGCDLGSPNTCYTLGDQKNAGGDLDGAMAAYTRACSLAPDSGACAQRDTLVPLIEARDQDAACAKNDAAACLKVGDRTIATAPAEAAAAYEKACAGKLAAGCTGAVGLTTDPLHRRELAQKGCDLGVASACGDVAAMWDQTGDQPKASAAWVKACEGAVYGACGQAATHLRPAKAKDKGTAQYRAVLDRGCLAGDQALCDEAKYGYGYVPPVTHSDSSSSTYASSVGSTYHAPRKLLGDLAARLELGYGSTTWSGSDAVTRYVGDIDLRRLSGRTSGLLVLLRGELQYDTQETFGYDAAIGLGFHYKLGPIRSQVLGVGGRDKIGAGATMDPAVFGIGAAWYAGIEARGRMGLGRLGLVGTYGRMYRDGEGDETRFDVSIDLARPGRVYGLGVRGVEYALPTKTSEVGLFLYLQR